MPKKQKIQKKYERKNKGITVIALVITIIILLILAVVAIATITGEDGILNKSIEAKKQNEEATDIEKIRLAVTEAKIGESGYQKIDASNLQEAIDNQFIGRDIVVSINGDGTFTVSCLDTLKDYKVTSNGIDDGIDWNEAMVNAVAPESQDETRNEGVVGIGTDGKVVDMDLWEYVLLEDKTFALNDEEALNDTNKTPGYKFGNDGENIIDGKIIGTVPQYISMDEGKTYYPVTNLTCTFCENTYLKYAPIIPVTVTNMDRTFIRCYNLEKLENFSPKTITMDSAFKSTKIESIPNIPDSVIYMPGAFFSCSELKSITNIPKNVVNIFQTFYNCTKLTNVNIEIPSTVNNMYMCFASCNTLSGIIIVKANISGTIENYEGCFGNTAISDNAQLILKCSENFYNLIYDETRPNNIKQGIASWEANIVLEKI